MTSIYLIVFYLVPLCRSVAVIKSNKDTRYALDSIVTHDGEKLPCWSLADLSSFRQKLGTEAYDKVCSVKIDPYLRNNATYEADNNCPGIHMIFCLPYTILQECKTWHFFS